MSSQFTAFGKKLARYMGNLRSAQPAAGHPSPPSARLTDTSEPNETARRSEEWAARAFVLLREALGVQKAALLSAKSEQDDPCALRVKLFPGGSSPALPTLIYWPLALCERFRNVETIVLRREIERLGEFQAVTMQEREWLHLLDMEVYISLGQECGLSVLAFGSNGPGAFYSRGDLALALLLVNRARNGNLFQEALRSKRVAHLGEALRLLEEAKSGFLTIASHELKTPLTLIQGYANMLNALSDEDLQNQERIAYITEGIIRGTGRLRQIIDDMLDVSRLDDQALNLQWRSCGLAQVIGLAVSQITPAAKDRRQVITIPPLEGLPVIEGDEQRLCQALRNVLENAIKYTPDGGQISISAQLLEDTPISRCIEIVIADQGIGIAPQNREVVFDKFSRLGDADLHSSSRVQFKGGGPGLGLAITRGIIEAHGGRVWVESEGYDEKRCPGSQFCIRLPLKRAAQIPLG
jgi:signal transduction histidine kinase